MPQLSCQALRLVHFSTTRPIPTAKAICCMLYPGHRGKHLKNSACRGIRQYSIKHSVAKGHSGQPILQKTHAMEKMRPILECLKGICLLSAIWPSLYFPKQG